MYGGETHHIKGEKGALEVMDKISYVRKNGDGDITAVKLSNGAVLNYDEALEMARQNKIAGATVGVARNGRPVLKGVADGNPANNLDNLPRF